MVTTHGAMHLTIASGTKVLIASVSTHQLNLRTIQQELRGRTCNLNFTEFFILFQLSR